MVGVLRHQPSFVYGPSSAEAKKTFYFEKTYFFILIYFYNATGEVNGNTWTTGTMNVCPNYLSFGLNNFSSSADVYFYKTSNIEDGQMIFNNVSMFFESDNGVQLNSSSKSISCSITQYEASPHSNPNAGTFSASVNKNGHIHIELMSNAWDSNHFIYNNTLCKAVIKADEFYNGKIYVDCYYA